jgi:hypothetical protein
MNPKKAIASELHRLENAGFIREIKASTWVSNPVIVERTRCRLEGGEVNRRFKNNYGIGLKECGIKLTFIFFKHKT